MFVLMDVEWYKAGKKNHLTQIAAVRLDRKLCREDTFYQCIQPPSTKGNIWGHSSFSGGRSKYQNAPKEDMVLLLFRDWMRGDDTILWWNRESEALFRTKYKTRFGMDPVPMGVIGDFVTKRLMVVPCPTRSARRLCSIVGVKAPDPVHNALTEISTIELLLRHGHMTCRDLVENGCMNLLPVEPKQAPIHVAKGPELIFFCDIETSIVHRKDCEQLDKIEKSHLKGFATAKGCRRQGLIPCDCCKNEIASQMLGTDNEANKVYRTKASGSRIVHYRDCSRIKSKEDEQLFVYEDLREARKDNCRLCNCCSKIYAQYKPLAERIHSFCAEHQLKDSFFDDAIHIFSAHDFWRIIWEPTSSNPVLYHRNRINYRQKDDTIEHYHRQKHVPGDIMKQIEYIVSHDNYVVEKKTR